jgi:CubicO group peptidase (beta-lactamase class C family)
MPDAPLMRGFPPAPEGQVTLANWLRPPFNRWSFQHVREVVPTAGIHRGDGPPAPLRRSERNIERIAFAKPAGTENPGSETTAGQMIAQTYTDGFLVLHRGRIVAERYDNAMTPSSRHIVFSVSKSITATLAGVLVDRGQLDPDSPVTRYVPEVANSAYGDSTVRHVLDMTVSVNFIEDYLDKTGDFARYRDSTGWIPIADPNNLGDLRSFLATMKRGAEPHGARFHYVSPNSDLLGWILERAAGQRYVQLLSELVWQPMGAECDADIAVERKGAARAAGGISATLRDLGRFGEMMRCRGMAAGHQVIPGWWIDDIRSQGDVAAWRKGEMAVQLPIHRYRSKWYSLDNGHGAFCAIGIHGQWIYIDPLAEAVIVKLSSQPLAVDEPMDRLSMAGFHGICLALMR